MIKNDNFFNLKIKKLPKQERALLKNARNEVIKELKNIGIQDIQTEEGSVLKEAWGRSCVKNKSFKSIFKLMTLYPANSIKSSYEITTGENWLENWHQHFLPILAGFSLKHSRAQLDFLVSQNPDLFEKNKKYSELYKNGVNDNTDEDTKNRFLFHTYMDIKHALPYGHANCALMADLAFLRAIDSPLTVTYIRFQSPEYEEINAIALGKFPDVGSLIVDPWSNRIFTWQGSVKDTPEVAAYAECKKICSNASDSKVRASFLTIPEYTEFKKYLSDANAHTKMREDIDKQRAEIKAVDRLFQATAADFYKTTG
ncbi:hypothetical protein Rin_00022130 [Candidatus Regiella insecticola 5.15]|uniref:Uncharacterized protein n=1 Tax=Candidatus Regiella insecticola 5.15 TaxID=1005043 RepID=G2H2B4_9ENTR|nr:hypothetical protein [Candidatus Regiella insecticola]EGY27868.1 hypothetical protein Rin_00022130 [Candidatus Regiella insecticola 5.15]